MYKSLSINYFSFVIVSVVVTFALLLSVFFAFEPVVVAADTDVFTVRQQITAELSFATSANNITMDSTIAGLTGGNANGTTTVAVRTNSSTGYTMTIQFASSSAMEEEAGPAYIPNYAPVVGGTPDYNFATMGTGQAGFAYSIYAVTSASDAATKFRNNGSACNISTGSTLGKCWYNATDATTPVQIINRSSETPITGATTTVAFQVGVGTNPSPILPSGFYTATTTLTAVVQ